MQIVPLSPRHIGAVAALWNEALRAAGSEAFDRPISSDHLRNAMSNANYLPSGALVALEGLAPVGFALGYVLTQDRHREGGLAEMPGYLAGLAVKPSHWGQGIGAQLLEATEQALREQGKDSVIFKTYSTAIPLTMGAAIDTEPFRFFARRGYRAIHHELVLRNDLRHWTLRDSIKQRRDALASEGITYRLFGPADRDELLDFSSRHFAPEWRTTLDLATIEFRPDYPIRLALDGDRLIGFMGPAWVPEPGGEGHFGSPGVDPKYRGRGIGKVIFHLGLNGLAEQGAVTTGYTTATWNPAQHIYFDSGAKLLGVIAETLEKPLA